MKNKQEEFEIEEGVPIPPQTRTAKYKWEKMKVGSSFFVPIKGDDDSKALGAKSAASSYGKRHHMEFKTRTVEGGIRIWRTK